MKKYLFLFLVSISFISCSNDDNVTNISTSEKILGVWNWDKSTGGFGGWTYTPESTGDTQRLEITGTTLKKYINDELVYETNYTIELRESVLFSGMHEMIVGDNGAGSIIEFSDNKLFLSDDCNDCFQSEYIRE